MRLKLLIFLSGLALLAVSAQADLSFILSPSVKSGTGSNEVVFIGTLTNTSLATNLFLNNVQFTFTNAATNFLTANTNTFFANTPGILLSNEAYSDVVFAIVVSAATPRGNYSGTATVLGGTNIFATN